MAIYNFKGGAAKTTLAVNLSAGVHLLKGESVNCASLGGEQLSVRTIGPLTSASVSVSTASLPVLMPFAGKGAPPTGGAAHAGTIAEIELTHEGRAQSVEIFITTAAAGGL